MELSEETETRIDLLAEEGNALLDGMGDWQGAIAVWQRALDLLPAPQSQWEQTVWLQASIGTAWRMGGEETRALEAFDAAYHAPDGHLNPFILVNLGALLIPRDAEAATQLLLRAYMLEGEEIFEAEEPARAFLAARVDLSKPPRH